MRTQLLISPPATGKTTKVIEHIQETLHKSPMAQVWVVVPDRLQSDAFKRQVALRGGALGAHIGTFGDIYTEILDLTGRSYPIASETITHLFIQAAITSLSTEGKLIHLGPISQMPGFLQLLSERFAELKRALVLPEELLSIIDKENSTIYELAHIYKEYQNKLQEFDWADQEGLSWLALEALENNESGLAHWDLIIVDGFDTFTPVQIRTLQLLAPRVQELIITLPGDQNMSRPTHQRFRRTLDSLAKDLDYAVKYLDPAPRLPGPLFHLEQNLFEPRSARFETTTEINTQQIPQVSMIEASSPAEEAREALRWIKALILRSNLSPSDCAIFTADINTYRSHLLEVAMEFGLPVSPSWGAPLTEYPASAALYNLLNLPIQDYPYRLTLDTIRSPYFDLGFFNLSPKDAHALELVSRARQIVGGEKNWIEALEYLALQAHPEEIAHEHSNLNQDEIGPTQLPYGEDAKQLAVNLNKLFRELSPPDRQSLRNWVQYINRLIEKIEFLSLCEQRVGEEFISILNDLYICDFLIGELELDYHAFVSTLNRALESAIFSGKNDSNKASIFLGQIIEARGLRFKAVALLGLAEGQFPTPERADPFINEQLRAKLGLEPSIGRHQNGLFYQAVTRADQYLYLSRPYLADDGEAWEPSYYWTQIEKIFPASTSRILSESERRLGNAASKEEALFWTIRQGESPKHDPELIKNVQRIKIAGQVLQSRLEHSPFSEYEGDLEELSHVLTHHFAYQHVWSASRLESYSTCPFLFFVAHLLALEVVETPELGFDPAQLGTMYHAILEKTFKKVVDPDDKETIIADLQSSASSVFEVAPEKYGFKPSAVWEAEKDEMLTKLEKTIAALVDDGQGWSPHRFEQIFGRRGTPALELETEFGTIRISGFIDRIDIQDNNLRIIDYKTGSGDFPKQDLLNGKILQLPIYGLAAQQALKLGVTTHGYYWRIHAAKPSSFRLEGFEHQGMVGSEAAFEVAVESIKRIVKNVRNGKFPPVPTKGVCPTYCPAASWCWRYKPSRF